jgi:pteridine reductase
MNSKSLQGQAAIVTGGAKRIGRAIGLTLAEAGAHVVVNYRSSEQAAAATARELEARGVRALLVAGDVSRPADVRQLIGTVQDTFGRVDILVNNAGIFEHASLEETTPEQWDRFMAVNLKAQFLTAQAAGPLMRAAGRGKIVNLASLGGLLAWPGFIPYCVSKAGVIHLTRCLARALAPEVQVNCVCPGTIQFEGEEPDANYLKRAPLKRTGRGEDIAQAVLYLVQADFVTGQVLVVDGGYSLA